MNSIKYINKLAQNRSSRLTFEGLMLKENKKLKNAMKILLQQLDYVESIGIAIKDYANEDISIKIGDLIFRCDDAKLRYARLYRNHVRKGIELFEVIPPEIINQCECSHFMYYDKVSDKFYPFFFDEEKISISNEKLNYISSLSKDELSHVELKHSKNEKLKEIFKEIMDSNKNIKSLGISVLDYKTDLLKRGNLLIEYFDHIRVLNLDGRLYTIDAIKDMELFKYTHFMYYDITKDEFYHKFPDRNNVMLIDTYISNNLVNCNIFYDDVTLTSTQLKLIDDSKNQDNSNLLNWEKWIKLYDSDASCDREVFNFEDKIIEISSYCNSRFVQDNDVDISVNISNSLKLWIKNNWHKMSNSTVLISECGSFALRINQSNAKDNYYSYDCVMGDDVETFNYIENLIKNRI